MFPVVEVLSGAGIGVLVVAFANGLRRVPFARSNVFACACELLILFFSFFFKILGNTWLELVWEDS
jgi:hypothetical protein